MADLQSTNRVKVSKVREAVFGVPPNNPAFKTLRVTSASLNAGPQTVVSEEIRSDRQVSDLILVGLQAQGDIGGELSFRAHDDDLEEAVQGTWINQPRVLNATADTEISDVSTTTLTVGSGLGSAFVAGMLCSLDGFATPANNRLARVSSSTGTTIVFPASTFTAEAVVPAGASVRCIGLQGASGDIAAVTSGGNALTSSVLDFVALEIEPGDWIKIGSSVTDTSFANIAANNGLARVSKVETNRLSLSVVPTGWAADNGSGKTIRIFTGDRLRNGTTKLSNTIERQYLDHSPVSYEYLTGMTLNQLSLEFGAQTIVTLTKSYMGKTGEVVTSRKAGATDVAAPTNDVLNSSSNVGTLMFDGVAVTGPNFILSASVNISNNLRMQNAVGSIGAVGIGNGELGITGSLSTYFGSPSVYEKLLNNSRTSLSMLLGRQDGNKESYLIDLPTIKLSSGAPAVSGKNNDVQLDGEYQAIQDATLGYTIGINRFWYLP